MEEEKRYKIEFDRKGCIGAAICCAVSERFWKFNHDDGKVDLEGSRRDKQNNTQVLAIPEKEFQENHDSALSCPAHVIHITDLKTGKKLI